MPKIDVQSEEFQKELEKTKAFTQKVVKNFGFEFNPDPGINEGITMGLTRQKVLHGKRYCPCFMVQGTKEDRICPCKPALEEEIPHDGHCHCGIFCSPEYAAMHRVELGMEEAAHSGARCLTKEEAELLLTHERIDADELTCLLELREHGDVDFALVDVRELVEYQVSHIKGTDVNIPMTQFYTSLDKLEPYKDKPMIFYCHLGNRSGFCQQMLKTMGESKVINFEKGFVSFDGEVEKG